MFMTNINRNAMPMESNAALMVHVLINGKEILPQTLQIRRSQKGF